MTFTLRRAGVLAALLALAACGAQSGGGAGADAGPGEAASAREGGDAARSKRSPAWELDDLVVKFRPGVDEEARAALHARVGPERVQPLRRLGLHKVRPSRFVPMLDALRRYRESPDVLYAEPALLRYPLETVPNDPQFASQWGLAAIGAPQAWDLTTGKRSSVVVVVDSGVDFTHPDLAPNAWSNPGEVAGNGKDDDGDGYVDDVRGIDAVFDDGDPSDEYGHGTQIAGIIGAVGNDARGVAGVTWSVQLAACRFIGGNGFGTTVGLLACLDWVADLKDRGVDVVAVNASYGGPDASDAERDAIALLRDKGVLVVAASGDRGLDEDAAPTYPASYPLANVVAVAASGRDDALAAFSNRGLHSVDVAAPGSEILTATLRGGYASGTGSSFAVPFVTGIAALLHAHRPELGWTGIRNAVLAGGDRKASLAPVTVTGRRVSAYGSLTCADQVVSAVLHPPGREFEVGTPVPLRVLSIRCAAPWAPAPIQATLSGGEVVTFRDDGAGLDEVAGDGIFTGSWTPSRSAETITYRLADGRSESVSVCNLAVSGNDALPRAVIGSPYQAAIPVRGGTGPFAWTLASGALPPGLTLSSDGRISGDPKQAGTFTFRVRVTDATNHSDEATRSIQVAGPDQWLSLTWRWNSDDRYPGSGRGVAVDAGGRAVVSGTDDRKTSALTLQVSPDGDLGWSTTQPAGNVSSAGLRVAAAPGGTTLVADWVWGFNTHQVLAYDADGRLRYSHPLAGEPSGIAVDATGAYYVALTSANRIAVSKYAAGGVPSWTRTYTDAYGKAAGVAVDGQGNVVVAGQTSAALTAIRYDAQGNLLWARSRKGGSSDQPEAVAAGLDGSVYVTGTTCIDSRCRQTAWYTAAWDASGALLWAQVTDSSPSEDMAHGIAVGPTGHVYVAGSASKNQGQILVQDPRTGVVASTLLYSAQGTFRSYFRDIAFDPQGDVRVAGDLQILGAAGLLYYPFVARFSHDLRIVTSALPDALVTSAYSATLAAVGADAPYTWSVASGALPTGLSLTAAGGRIEGIPAAAGAYPFRVRVTGVDGKAFERDLSITVR